MIAMKKFLLSAKTAFNSWWLAGLIGWGIIIWKYPIAAILPRYAG
jgi:hypothetical protein